MYNMDSVVNIGDKLLIHSIDGHRVFLDTEELHMTLHMIEHREWEPQIREIIAQCIGQGGVYIDIGANVGFHALYAAALCGESGHVYTVEPNERLMGILKTNMEVNGFRGRTTFIRKAIDNHEGERKFYLYKGHASMSGFMSESSEFEKVPVQETVVEVTCLDTLFKDLNCINLLKIDVEGFELGVIKGGGEVLKKTELTVILEWTPRLLRERSGENAPEEILSIFKENGYDVYCARYKEPLKKMDIGNVAEIVTKECCDLVFTRKQLQVEMKTDNNIGVRESLGEQNGELLHLRKAYKEAIAVQEELKEQLEHERSKNKLFVPKLKKFF